MLIGDGIGYVDFVFHPVGLLLKAQLLHVFGVVGVVVDGGHGAELFKALHQHAFGVEVGKSQGALDVGHASFASPLLHGFYQGAAHLFVVHKVNPAKANVLGGPGVVGLVVDDGSHAAHNLPLTPGEEIVGLAKLKCGVVLLVEGAEHVVEEVGY